MAEEENRSGLLSKVAKFVRNPTKDWSELDQKEPENEGGYSKEALKEMIERKRQNDFVRKREFDHLRKLRRRDPLGPLDQARPSFFQSSMTSNHDDRAETLKKIDEIEAQMSRQWWKGKEAASRAGAFPVASSGLRPEVGQTQPFTQPMTQPLSSAVPMDTVPPAYNADDSHFASTQASALRPDSSQWGETPGGGNEYVPTQPASMALRQSLAAGASRSQPLSGASHLPVGAGFSTQRLYAQVPTDNLTDPDLEDAAIRFANGDDAGAEDSLMSALGHLEGQHPELAETWMSALFDLYRATGQQARFDNVALEFANRYGRSAPAWFSMPELVEHSKSTAPAKPRASTVSSPADWSAPAQLTAASLEELQALMRIPGALVLDWQALTMVGPDAVPLLARLVAYWCATPAVLVIRGHGSLERALQALTPSGDRTVDTSCWQLRMDTLRIMRLQDAFELVALDYCVTYEVSPPSWQEPRCSCELQGLDPAVAEAEDIRSRWDEASQGWDDPRKGVTVPGGMLEPPPAVVELQGQIIGDAAEVLSRLETGMEGSTRMVVSCERLIRVDFSAAGSILNWVAGQQGRGCQVQFRDVNRMVAAFFNVIGISEHARVVPRAA